MPNKVGHLHIVDLDGAFAGTPENMAAVEAAARASCAFTQLGGIRDLTTIEAWLQKGIDRVILHRRFARPALVHQGCRMFPGRIAVGIDAREGFVAVEGWAKKSNLSAIELAKRFEDAGVAALIYTDIDRDGLLKGVNVAATQTARPCRCPSRFAAWPDCRMCATSSRLQIAALLGLFPASAL